ncbi:MAG: O-antigen ligase family protein [Erysipelotrichaceae bacterium]
MNILKKLSDQKLIGIQCCLLVALQPILDIYRTFIGNKFQLFGISLLEILNFVFIGYLFLLTIYNKEFRKNIKYIIIYCAFLIVYLIFHLYNITQFDLSILNGSTHSLITELYFIIRSYLFPLLVLYIFLNSHIERKMVLRTISYISFFICIIIIFTNITKSSFITYASDLPEFSTISNNIFDWFTQTKFESVSLLTSKGWFYSGNQISIILFMLLPVVLYSLMSPWRSKIDALCVMIHPIAMIMVGTKTAGFGSIIIISLSIILYLLFSVIMKQIKFNKHVFVIMLLSFLCATFLIIKSPVMQGVLDQKSLSFEENEKIEEELSNIPRNYKDINIHQLSTLINENHNYFGIHKDYLKLYPVEKNPKFWFHVMLDNTQSQMNFRNFKVRIYKEVLKDSGNSLDRWTGIGYVSNFPYVESDIRGQNVWFGYLGTLMFIGPFIVAFLWSVIKIIKNIKQHFNLQVCMIGMAVSAGIVLSYLAGHLFGYLFPVITFCFIEGFLIQSIRENKLD